MRKCYCASGFAQWAQVTELISCPVPLSLRRGYLIRRYTYERNAIEAWMRGHDRSPVEPDRRLDRHKELVPNLTMRAHLSMFVKSTGA